MSLCTFMAPIGSVSVLLLCLLARLFGSDWASRDCLSNDTFIFSLQSHLKETVMRGSRPFHLAVDCTPDLFEDESANFLLNDLSSGFLRAHSLLPCAQFAGSAQCTLAWCGAALTHAQQAGPCCAPFAVPTQCTLDRCGARLTYAL